MCKLGIIILLHYNVVVTYCTAFQSTRPVKVVLSQSIRILSALYLHFSVQKLLNEMFFKTKFSSCYSHVVWIENVTNGKYINILPSGHIWLRPEHETSRSSPVSELWFVSCIFGYTDICCIYTVLELAVSALLWEWSYLCFLLLEFTVSIAEMSKLYWTVHTI